MGELGRKGNFSNVFFGFARGGFTVPPPRLARFSEMQPGVGVVLPLLSDNAASECQYVVMQAALACCGAERIERDCARPHLLRRVEAYEAGTIGVLVQ